MGEMTENQKLKEESERLVALARAISKACFEEAESLRAEIAELKQKLEAAQKLCRLKMLWFEDAEHDSSFELAAFSSEIIDILTGKPIADPVSKEIGGAK